MKKLAKLGITRDYKDFDPITLEIFLAIENEFIFQESEELKRGRST